MKQTIFTPSYPLSEFVDTIWIASSSCLNIKHSHHPALFTELIFNYGSCFDVRGQNVFQSTGTMSTHIVSGLKTHTFDTRVVGKYLCIGLILKPFCCSLMKNILNTPKMDYLSDIMYEYLICSNQFDKLEKILIVFFSSFKMDFSLLSFNKYLEKESFSKGMLNEFVSTIDISQKSFIEKFKNQYLIKPIEYINLIKINKTICLLENKNNKLTDVALEGGFYDQSHFIRVFKKYCNCTPKEYSQNMIR